MMDLFLNSMLFAILSSLSVSSFLLYMVWPDWSIFHYWKIKVLDYAELNQKHLVEKALGGCKICTSVQFSFWSFLPICCLVNQYPDSVIIIHLTLLLYVIFAGTALLSFKIENAKYLAYGFMVLNVIGLVVFAHLNQSPLLIFQLFFSCSLTAFFTKIFNVFDNYLRIYE